MRHRRGDLAVRRRTAARSGHAGRDVVHECGDDQGRPALLRAWHGGLGRPADGGSWTPAGRCWPDAKRSTSPGRGGRTCGPGSGTASPRSSAGRYSCSPSPLRCSPRTGGGCRVGRSVPPRLWRQAVLCRGTARTPPCWRPCSLPRQACRSTSGARSLPRWAD